MTQHPLASRTAIASVRTVSGIRSAPALGAVSLKTYRDPLNRILVGVGDSNDERIRKGISDDTGLAIAVDYIDLRRPKFARERKAVLRALERRHSKPEKANPSKQTSRFVHRGRMVTMVTKGRHSMCRPGEDYRSRKCLLTLGLTSLVGALL
jgi:hypothetical protein